MPLKIIGVGFGGTGTSTLDQALTSLGYKVLHTTKVQERPWLDAWQGKRVDWEKLLDGSDAIVDWIGVAFYRELLDQYPDAKVILTVSDSPSQWYNNSRCLQRSSPSSWPFYSSYTANKLWDTLVVQGLFHGQLDDPKYAYGIYLEHIEEVKRCIPQDRLLIYNIKEGWEQLCQFLEQPIPSKSFPTDSTTVEVEKDLAIIRKKHALGKMQHITLFATITFIAMLTLKRGGLKQFIPFPRK
ncbi:uncharacterized protein VTP21DRAFT_8371 [Calcarisporiella thermophila]|uniref:uncharacterized protein n=1 Tax=Calcarisporiella thermophila TaxID=911321 RepID=UPI0037442B95